MTLGYSTKDPWGNQTGFKDKILNGEKIHTLREDPKDRWKHGKLIHHVVGNRTKQREEFRRDTCSGTQKVEIVFNEHDRIERVNVDYKPIADWKQLAKNDGLTPELFERWFVRAAVGILGTQIKVWTGKIIHWTNKRY